MIKRNWLIVLLVLLCVCTCALASEGAACDHDMYLKERVESTCTRHGWEIRACSKCTYTESKNLKIKEHDWERIKKVESTCTKEGYKKYECENCHATMKKELPLADHAYGSWKVTQQPTCTEKGVRVRYCVDCGAKSTGSLAKLPHPFGSWTVVREATDRSMGIEQHVCTACRLLETRDFYPQGALYPDLEKHAGVRTLQEFLIEKGLLDSRVDGNYGKKTQEAVKAYQQLMGYEPTGIAYPQTLTAIFCTTQGKDGAAAMTNNPHVYGDWTILTEAKSNAQGLRTHTCLFCGYACEEAYDPAGTLRLGMEKNDAVKELQKLLIEHRIIKTVADGDYGPRTELGVKTFQQMAGLEATGVCYPETLEALRNWTSK